MNKIKIIVLMILAIGFVMASNDEKLLESRISNARSGSLDLKNPWKPSQVPFFKHFQKFEYQPHDKFWVAWTPSVEDNQISFTLAVNTVGWIGWGITETGGMLDGNPDLIVAAGADGNAQCIASHTRGFSQPISNKVQNCDIFEYVTIGDETLVTFTRPFFADTNEDISFIDNEHQATRMMGAFGMTQDLSQHEKESRFNTFINAVQGPINFQNKHPDSRQYNCQYAGCQGGDGANHRDYFAPNQHNKSVTSDYHIHQQGKQLPVAAIAGGTVGAVAGVAIIGAAGFFGYKGGYFTKMASKLPFGKGASKDTPMQ